MWLARSVSFEWWNREDLTDQNWSPWLECDPKVCLISSQKVEMNTPFCGILRSLCDSSLLSSTNLSRRRQPCPARSVICHNCRLTNDRFYCPRRSCDTGTVTYVGFEPVTNSIRYWSTNHIPIDRYVNAVRFLLESSVFRRSRWAKLWSRVRSR